MSSTELVEVLNEISAQCSMLRNKKPFFVVTVNPEFIMLAQDDPEFKKILNLADLAIPDGVGLKLAKSDLVIIPGRKLVEEILRTKKYKVFFLGGQNGVAAKMAKKYGGFFDEGEVNIKNPARNAEIVAKINSFRPDILLVAYGAPYQEKWLYANRRLLNARVLIGIGGVFDYLTGQAKLPPEWVNKAGLEWLWRLVHEPWRWRRQLSLVRFVLLQIFSPRRLLSSR